MSFWSDFIEWFRREPEPIEKMKKYLITGLGNPGPGYAGTRHNIGFDILDALAREYEINFTPGRLGDIAKIRHKGRLIILLKPSTYMNLSGKAVRYWMQKEKIEVGNLLVVSDDLSLPVGALRLKGKGGAGGHNGLQNIQDILGTSTYPRLRFGIGNDYPKGAQSDFVLSPWKEEEMSLVEKRIPVFIQAILSFVTAGLNETMNRYNGK